MPKVPPHGRWRQEDGMVEASLGYIVRFKCSLGYIRDEFRKQIVKSKQLCLLLPM